MPGARIFVITMGSGQEMRQGEFIQANVLHKEA